MIVPIESLEAAEAVAERDRIYPPVEETEEVEVPLDGFTLVVVRFFESLTEGQGNFPA